MYLALKQISQEYQTPEQLRRNSSKQYGLDYEEALEMAYENIQQLAKDATRGISIKPRKKRNAQASVATAAEQTDNP